jgi:glycosidase
MLSSRAAKGTIFLIIATAALFVSAPAGLAEVLHDSAQESLLKKVRFTFEPQETYRQVFLAGTFNDWSTDATPMRSADGRFEVVLPLPAGEYQYKFVADGEWITDMTAKGFHPDGFGGQNSVIIVDSGSEPVVLIRGDGRVLTEGLEHGTDAWSRALHSDGTVTLRLKTWAGDVERVSVWFVSGASSGFRMERTGSDGHYDYYSRRLEVDERIEYRFALVDGETVVWLGPDGVTEAASEEKVGLYEFTVDEHVVFETPEWVKEAVFYQIFPERFANGNPGNDPDFSEVYYEGLTHLPESGKFDGEYFHLVDDWYDVAGLSASPYRTDGKPDWYSFYGGDLAGVRDNLDYLVDLGVTAIYFNPIFESKSSHKYDAATYERVDPHLGSNEQFSDFVDECHSRGIRVVLDLAINHTGETHWAFVDTREKGDASDYWEWYEWTKWPLPDGWWSGNAEYYDCWWGFGQMPNLNFDLSRPNQEEHSITEIAEAKPNRPLVDHLLDVAEYWLVDIGVDGYRLDVAGEVPFWFWELFRERVKSAKPDAYIVGELWGASPDYVNGRCFDALMNYKFFRDPVTKFIAEGSMKAPEFDRALAPGRLIYTDEGAQAMMNLVGSHDTERFLRVCGGDAERVRLAFLFAATYVGAPYIYYGDEILMDGGGDPDCRRPFNWRWAEDPSRVALHDDFRRLLAIRKEHDCLTRGSFETLLTDDGVYAFVRSTDEEMVVVVMNARGREVTAHVPVGATSAAFFSGTEGSPRWMHNLLNGEQFSVEKAGDGVVVTIGLGPFEGAILVPRAAIRDGGLPEAE